MPLFSSLYPLPWSSLSTSISALCVTRSEETRAAVASAEQLHGGERHAAPSPPHCAGEECERHLYDCAQRRNCKKPQVWLVHLRSCK